MANSITQDGTNFGGNSNSALGDALSTFSVSFWIKSTDTANGHVILEKGDLFSNGWALSTNGSGVINYNIDDGSANDNFTLTGWNNGHWNNIVFAVDTGTGALMYLNGVVSHPSGSAITTPSSTTDPFAIGSMGFSAIVAKFYDIRFYNSTLTAGDVNVIVAGGEPGVPAAEWPFTESSGTTFADSTGNGNTLTFSASPTPISSSDIPMFTNVKKKASTFLVF